MNTENDSEKNVIERQGAESSFYDTQYGQGDHFPKHYAVHPTYPIYQKMLVMVGDLSDKCVLEYGCGEGWITKDLAQKGALVSAFDISAEAVRKTQEVLAARSLADRCNVAQMGAEKLIYPDESFDIVTGFAIIHHLDLNLAVPELYRVLKPGGVAYFAEPLGGNPIINFYRRLTPQYRTEDEKPLNIKKVMPLLCQFREIEHKEFYLIALISVALTYLPFGRRLFPTMNRQMMKFDNVLLSRFPRLGNMAWYTILKMRK